jgi:hypothetical protein
MLADTDTHTAARAFGKTHTVDILVPIRLGSQKGQMVRVDTCSVVAFVRDLMRSSVPHLQLARACQDLVHHGHMMRVELALGAIRAGESQNGIVRLRLLPARRHSAADSVRRSVTAILLTGCAGTHTFPDLSKVHGVASQVLVVCFRSHSKSVSAIHNTYQSTMEIGTI